MSGELDWLALSRAADDVVADPLELKRQLDLVAVCEELGVFLEEGPDGKFHGLCPFHDDHTPSFDVYDVEDQGFQRAGCMACDFGPSNDVYDLLRRLRGYGFVDALREAQSMLYAQRSSGHARERRPARQPVDLTQMVEASTARAAADATLVTTLLHSRNLAIPTDWVLAEFGVGVSLDEQAVVVPHRDRDGRVVAAKTRRQAIGDDSHPWKPVAIGGSRLDTLYGVHRDRGHKKVIIVEGESDTWVVSYLVRLLDVDVFGLPSGAAAIPKRAWVDYLADRDVTLLFDADDAGRTALKNWATALGPVRIAQLDEGEDAGSTRADRLLAALAYSRVVGIAPRPGLAEAPFGGYVRAGTDDPAMLSDFTLELVRTVELPGDGYVFEVRLPSTAVVALPSTELESDAKFRRWTTRYGYVWNGRTKDTQEVLRMLMMDAIFRPRVRGTKILGWNEGAFVLPEPFGVLGSKAWAYVPPQAEVQVHEMLKLGRGRWDPTIPVALTRLHRLDVITPIIGWIAASVLRPQVKAFPFLSVVGGAGWGKTTLVRESLATFGFEANLTLTSSTPYGVEGFVSSTNAIPVWVDEYRQGARADAKQRFESLLRDAWESGKSYKGGQGENRQQIHVVEASAPLVVTGEYSFQETSHVERTVMIQLPRLGRNPQALEHLFAIEREGFGRAYLEWIIASLVAGSLPAPPEVRDRPSHGRAVVAWGYSLFDQFAREVCGVEAPPFDDSLITKAHGYATAHPILFDALEAVEGRFSRGGPVAWREGDDWCVRVHDLVRECRDLQLPLPGGARALKAEMEERFIVAEERNEWGTYLRLRRRDD